MGVIDARSSRSRWVFVRAEQRILEETTQGNRKWENEQRNEKRDEGRTNETTQAQYNLNNPQSVQINKLARLYLVDGVDVRNSNSGRIS